MEENKEKITLFIYHDDGMVQVAASPNPEFFKNVEIYMVSSGGGNWQVPSPSKKGRFNAFVFDGPFSVVKGDDSILKNGCLSLSSLSYEENRFMTQYLRKTGELKRFLLFFGDEKGKWQSLSIGELVNEAHKITGYIPASLNDEQKVMWAVAAVTNNGARVVPMPNGRFLFWSDS